jgi:tetratricopeptide (TPR) repeat protein
MKNSMKKTVVLKTALISVFLFSGLAAQAADLPDFFIILRDAVYEQNLNAGEVAVLYRDALEKANTLTEPEKSVILSRSCYMMGRAYQYEEQKDEAASRYEDGMKWAQKAIDGGAGDTGWQMLAENLSQSCAVKPVSFAMSNGLKVEKYAKNALELNSRNAASQYMIAARWVFAPAPFSNLKRGIQMMEAITGAGDMDRDDEFNVYSAIGYAYVQQKKYADAKPWLLKSLEVYPGNKYVLSLLGKS